MNTKEILNILIKYNNIVFDCGVSKEEKIKIEQLLKNNPCLVTLCNDIYNAGKHNIK